MQLSQVRAWRHAALIDQAACVVPVSLVVLAFMLVWFCDQYPSMLPFWAPWEFSPPVFLSTTLSLWWYASGLRLTDLDERPAPGHRLLFVVGVLAIYAVLQTRFEYLAQHMFFLHRVQHLVMHHLGPFLIAMAWPGETLMRGMPAAVRRLIRNPILLRAITVLQQPVLASLLFVGLIFFWLIPPIHLFAMLSPWGYALMNWSMVVDGLLFWCLVMDPRPAPPGHGPPGRISAGHLSPGHLSPRHPSPGHPSRTRLSMIGRLVMVLVIQMPQIAGGAIIAFSGLDLYSYYALCGRIYTVMDGSMDQQIGGFIIIFPAAMMSVLAALIIVNRMWKQHEAEQALTARASVTVGA